MIIGIICGAIDVVIALKISQRDRDICFTKHVGACGLELFHRFGVFIKDIVFERWIAPGRCRTGNMKRLLYRHGNAVERTSDTALG